VRALSDRGAEVHGMVRATSNLWRIADLGPSLRLHIADVTEQNDVDEVVDDLRPDVLFHLAAAPGHHRSSAERADALRTSVLGTFHLLEAAARVGVRRFVHAGSSLEYAPSGGGLDERSPVAPPTFRGVAKAAATFLCLHYARAGRVPGVVLRLFHVYGYWEQPGRLIPTAIVTALQGGELVLTAEDHGRDHVFVEDAVEAMVLAADSDGAIGELVNVGSGELWTNREIVAMVEELTGRRIAVQRGRHGSPPPDDTRRVALVGRSRSLLAWEPRHAFPEGMAKTVAWFRTHADRYPATVAGKR
jgi:nucleoside-diphosphate-sugar epimerase